MFWNAYGKICDTWKRMLKVKNEILRNVEKLLSLSPTIFLNSALFFYATNFPGYFTFLFLPK